MLAAWVSEVAEDPVVIRLSDVRAEARGNLWSFSLTPEQAAATSVEEIEEFMLAILEGRRQWIRKEKRPPGAMTFYCWHDEQTGQLRCSVASVPPERLPFDQCVAVPASLETVVSEFLKLQILDPSDAPEEPLLKEPRRLHVWSAGVI